MKNILRVLCSLVLVIVVTIACSPSQAHIPSTSTLPPLQDTAVMAQRNPTMTKTMASATAAAATPTINPVTNQTLDPAIASATLPASATPTLDPTSLTPKYWTSWPVVPFVTTQMKEVYQKGIAMGNDPYAFSVLGDCQSAPNVFMGIFETERGNLIGEYADLQPTVDHFWGSFAHHSVSVKDGMSVASALSPLWADPARCEPNETPLDCELRTHKPAILFINLGTVWQENSAGSYEKYLRQVIDKTLERGVVPILSTKADNIEGDYGLNKVTVKAAFDYGVPLWNFWLAADALPGHGLDGTRKDAGYLTPEAWGLRSYSGLKALNGVWQALRQVYDPPARTIAATATGSPAILETPETTLSQPSPQPAFTLSPSLPPS